MEFNTKSLTIGLHVIFLLLFIFEVFKLLFGKDIGSSYARKQFKKKFTRPIFWSYLTIFVIITIFLNNKDLMKNIDNDKLNIFKQSINLGWVVFVTTFFAQAGFTIALAVIVAFLYMFFKIDI